MRNLDEVNGEYLASMLARGTQTRGREECGLGMKSAYGMELVGMADEDGMMRCASTGGKPPFLFPGVDAGAQSPVCSPLHTQIRNTASNKHLVLDHVFIYSSCFANILSSISQVGYVSGVHFGPFFPTETQ